MAKFVLRLFTSITHFWRTQNFQILMHTRKKMFLSSAHIDFALRDGTEVRALASHQCVPGWIPGTRRHMWVEFVVGSLPCSKRFYSLYSGFPLSSKPIFPNTNWIWIIVKHFIMSLWFVWWRKHSLCLTLNLQVDLHLRVPCRDVLSTNNNNNNNILLLYN